MGINVNLVLWILQVLLAIAFVLHGWLYLYAARVLDAALALTPDQLTFIGIAELLGALGLILPGLTRVRPWLTPLAAAGLVLVTGGATLFTCRGARLPSRLARRCCWRCRALWHMGGGRFAPLASGRQPEVGSREG